MHTSTAVAQPHCDATMQTLYRDADSSLLFSPNALNVSRLFEDLNNRLKGATSREARSAVRSEYMRRVTDWHFDTEVLAVWIYDFFNEQHPADIQGSVLKWRIEFQEQIKNEACQEFIEVMEKGREILLRKTKFESDSHRRHVCIEAIKSNWGIRVVVRYDWFSSPIAFLNSARQTAKLHRWTAACRIFNRILLERMEETWQNENHYGSAVNPIKQKDLKTLLKGGADHMRVSQTAEWFANDGNWRGSTHQELIKDDDFERHGISSQTIARFGLQFDECGLLILKSNGMSRHVLPVLEAETASAGQGNEETNEAATSLLLIAASQKTNEKPQDDTTSTSMSEEPQLPSQTAQEASSPETIATTDSRTTALKRKRPAHCRVSEADGPESIPREQADRRQRPENTAGPRRKVSEPVTKAQTKTVDCSQPSAPPRGVLTTSRLTTSAHSNIRNATTKPTSDAITTKVEIDWNVAMTATKAKRERVKERIREVLEAEFPDQALVISCKVGRRK